MTTTFAQLRATFTAYDTIIIHRHINPDPDAFGAQMGLAALLRAAYPSKHVYTVGEPVATLNWIGRPQTIPDSVYTGALVVVIDTANQARIADSRYTLGAKLMKIDHHPDREPFGDISYVDTSASSSAEIVALLAAANPDWPLDQTSAAALYAGIIGDTGRFLYDLATARTHRVVADLMATGIDAPAIGRQEEEISLAEARLISDALQTVTVTAGVGALTFTQAKLKALDLAPGEEQLALSYIGQLRPVRVWALFTQRPDGCYRVELRSKAANINGIAVAHGGGGHPLASGAVAADAQECAQIVRELSALG
ncbi:DHH family phosphoesterase [Lacticaseibacillus nasuensis]|uniref:DHH family phosphoesterase n=1 Tax=Lacticaseibacillus nasuensis TaxID=944671 RepID=UPI002248488D|nr:bifunctional oligoribonuclease/PAP phosphatase NrnA [Lacticaseibacillus nasuensis]MCX2454579.1 bifunctional oligoribonuclease/PAP phosphatase NrnA [Lacticaseibacillus nasuensis]